MTQALTSPDPARAAVPLLPPRPNLGPEPWPEPAPSLGQLAAGGALLLALAAAVVVLARRRRRPRKTITTPEPPSTPNGPASPRDRLLAASATIRRAIAARFGPPWHARTTEELAQSPDLSGWLGPDRAAEALRLLAEADRAKFARAASNPDPDQSEAWEALAASVRDAAAGTGATSIRNGR